MIKRLPSPCTSGWLRRGFFPPSPGRPEAERGAPGELSAEPTGPAVIWGGPGAPLWVSAVECVGGGDPAPPRCSSCGSGRVSAGRVRGDARFIGLCSLRSPPLSSRFQTGRGAPWR